MMYFTVSGETFVVASKAGAPENPACHHNLVAKANPGFAGYQAKTDRVIPVIRIARKPD
jgi:hypothetical protein